MQWVKPVKRAFTAEQFDRYVKRLQWTSWRPSFVVLHNTGVPKLSDWHKASGKVRMNGLEHYYRDQMGWHAGPHLFVADDFIWCFTPLTSPGVHSPSFNNTSVGVEMVGDYDVEEFNPKVRNNAIAALASIHSVLGLDSATLKLHKEDPRTTHRHCPGAHVSKEDIVNAVHNLLLLRHNGEHLPS